MLVGVDDIPTRWNLQAERPRLLVIGATTHWSVMASFHREGLPCAGCAHPSDDANNAPIPTVAFVSFLAGLFAATYFVQDLTDDLVPIEQMKYVTALRPETLWVSPLAFRNECPATDHSAEVSMGLR